MGFSVIPPPEVSGLTGPQGPAGTVPSDPVFSGSAGINGTTGDPNLTLKKNGATRWKIRSAGTESGSNNGSDLWVEAFADDGTTKASTPLWISRTLGQVVVGAADSSQTGVKLSVADGIGVRNQAGDPATSSIGAQLYAKAGKLWAQTANGAEKFQIVEALPKNGNAQLNGQYLWLDTAAGLYRAFGYRTAGVDRWLFQVDDLAETGSNLGSNFRLSARNDDGSFNKTVIYARRDSGQIAFNSTAPHGSAVVTVNGTFALKDSTGDPATTAGGAFLYSKGGVAHVKQPDGLVVPIRHRPSEFLPEDLGLAAWTSDPMDCVSTGGYTGTTNARVAAVYLREPKTVSKIVWHFTGYAGGLLPGSWAAVYDAAGTRVAFNDSIHTGTNEPAEQYGLGGGASYVPITSTTLPAGLYFIVWRFNYTTSPVDGPMCLQYENNAGAPPGTFGLNGTIRFGVISAASQATSFTSLTVANIQNGANRFWAALA
ncbi:hypothetical protein [Streptomyces collinus]|uniref:hypothetical protein n=1 Tax=Streptomyces collinus TaxID=42684 RepID=UPI00379497BA